MRLTPLQLALALAACSGTHGADAGADAGLPDAGFDAGRADSGLAPTDAGPQDVVCPAAASTDRCASVSCPVGQACLAGECFDACGDLGVLERALHSATVRDVWCLPGDAFAVSTYRGTEPGAAASIRVYAVTGAFDGSGYAHEVTLLQGRDDLDLGLSHDPPEFLASGLVELDLAGGLRVPTGGVSIWARGDIYSLAVRTVRSDGEPGRGWVADFDALRGRLTLERFGGGVLIVHAAGVSASGAGLYRRGVSGALDLVARHSLVPGGVAQLSEVDARNRGVAFGVVTASGPRAGFAPTRLLDPASPVDLETNEDVAWFEGVGPRVAHEDDETVWAWNHDAPLFRFYKPPTPSSYECQRVANPTDGRLPILDVVTSVEVPPMLAFDTDGDGRAEGLALLGYR